MGFEVLDFRFLKADFLEVEVWGFEILFLETLDFEIQLQFQLLLLVLLNFRSTLLLNFFLP